MSRCAPSDWVPGLLHGEKTLREVLDTLPGIDAIQIPRVVRLFENPSSRWSLIGATTLFRHDCIHVMLGRGLSAEDEAFVLGYTMGQSDGTENTMKRVLRCLAPIRPRDLHYQIFRFVSHCLYPKSLRLSKENLRIFNLGLSLGEISRCRNIEHFPFEWHMDDSIASLRQRLHINVNRIEAFNRFEQILSPGPAAARRREEAIELDRCEAAIRAALVKE